jgi:capsular polysaccharide biosynthesis protein
VARLNARLRLGIDAPARPGLFLTRGGSGDRRLLVNESEIAARLRDEHGFLVLDPLACAVPELIAACAGARVIAGIEGSHLCHALMVMSPGATLLTLQPPDRVTSVLKITTDRQGWNFALVIGAGTRAGFHVDWSEVPRTLAAIDARAACNAPLTPACETADMGVAMLPGRNVSNAIFRDQG